MSPLAPSTVCVMGNPMKAQLVNTVRNMRTRRSASGTRVKAKFAKRIMPPCTAMESSSMKPSSGSASRGMLRSRLATMAKGSAKSMMNPDSLREKAASTTRALRAA